MAEEKKNGEAEETLSFNEYQKHCFNLISEDGRKDMIGNGVLGLAGETGECCDIVKKYKYQRHPLDKEHLKDELGDVLWYIAETASGLGITLEEVAKFNLKKLRARYHGETWSAEDDINRKDKL